MFACENLEVWHLAVKFSKTIIDSIETINCDRKHYRLIEQLESCSASIAANIAEGKGRYSKKEFIQFLYISRGSLYETITFLKIFSEKGWITEFRFKELKIQGACIGQKISSLINSIRDSQ